jgi:anti-sigma regulatory factor (Ser/Thr protein kinase)
MGAKAKQGAESQKTVGSELLLRMQLESSPDALCLVRAAVERATELLHFPASDSRAIVRSVDEALANVIRHAYAGRSGLPIEITCRRLRAESAFSAKAGIEILLEDSGIAADPATLKGRSLDEIRPGGLGLHFMRQSMDVVEFGRNHGKNQLRLVKYLVPATAAARPLAKPEGE